MPDSYIEWAWFAFFCLGTIGGWGALLRTLQLWVDDRWQPKSRPYEDDDFTNVEFESVPPPPDTRTRANLPVYQPRRR